MGTKLSDRKVFVLVALVMAILIAILMFATYAKDYCIKPDNSGLYAQVNSWLSRGETPRQHEVILFDTIDIGWERYTLAQLDGQLSILQLRKGLTGNYKLESFSRGTAAFRDEIVFYDPPFSKENAYFYLLGGYNPDGRIAGIHITMDGETYNIPVLSDEHFFFTQTLVQVDSTGARPDHGNIRFYDAFGNDITAEVPRTIQ